MAWEAQFGDFANGAQTVVDEFISSAEQKWGQASSVTLLLPHGYEGQGPDHSSGRIERYLQLAAEDNMWICQPSTPANHFHLTRHQAYRRPRTPLIEFTPKQLLRLSAATSSVDEFTSGTFLPVIGEVSRDVGQNANGVRRVLVCSGRIYYDLVKERDAQNRTDVAVVRLEQFYPLATSELAEALAPYENAEVVWVQDEPENQGAWFFLAMNLFPALGCYPTSVAWQEIYLLFGSYRGMKGHRQLLACRGATKRNEPLFWRRPSRSAPATAGERNAAGMPTAHEFSWAVTISQRSKDQLFGRLPWFAAFLRRSRRFRPRVLISKSFRLYPSGCTTLLIIAHLGRRA